MSANEQGGGLGKCLLASIEEGGEAAALSRLDEWKRQGPSPQDDSELIQEAFVQACYVGFARLARAMLLTLPETQLRRDSAFVDVAECFDHALLAAVIDLLDEDELWRMAATASRSLDDRPESGEDFVNLLVERAREFRRADWKGAQSDEGGLGGRWERRARGLYETACDAGGVPIWSATAVPCLADTSRALQAPRSLSLSNAWEGYPETLVQSDWALGLPEETLLWSADTVEVWRSEISSHLGDPAWRPTDFEALAGSWDAARALLPWIRDEMERCRKEHGGRRAEGIAECVVEAGAQRWIPFILAWANHTGFTDEDAVRFAPMLDAARVDVCNVGLVAANVDYGSFNGRLARIVEEVRRRGGMDDAAVLVVHARWEDLFANPAWQAFFARSSFQNDFLASRSFFEGEALCIEVGSGIKKARPRSI